MSDLLNPIFQDETKAREWLEARIWAHGRFCPHCGAIDQSTLLQRGTKPRQGQLEKKRPHRDGLYQCNSCRQPFTAVTALPG